MHIVVLFPLFLLLAAAGSVSAQDPPIAGYQGGAGGASSVTFPSWVNNETYVVEVTAGPDGSTVCALGLGDRWPGRGPDLNNIDKDQALACAPVTQGKVFLQIKINESRPYVEALTWMQEYQGKRKWFPHPGIGDLDGSGDGPYVFRNVDKQPLTAWVVDPARKEVRVFSNRDAFRAMK